MSTKDYDVLEEYKKLATTANKTYYWPAQPQQGGCPNCGYCPHCGRGGDYYKPIRPYYEVWC